ncbi:hypothetical protein PENVUL_c051G04676 [Penicillium vulpinum]|uniref:Glutaminase A central domain-containing protein n=1 Tax=Penicillium vulpinum TaxID=29845 RepID=A0A1V6RFU8_9EURO|nr:hypothetical protein PENVUL_c051G04676 [Penicillium vulpinum]
MTQEDRQGSTLLKHVRGLFVDGGLSGEDDTWGEGNVVALAHNLGKVSGKLSVNFVVGALSFFLDDYNSALTESLKLDQELVTLSAVAAGSKYADILALPTRQAYRGIDLFIPKGSLDTDEVLAFIKEISSNGNINTIDVIMPIFPIYYVMDLDYIRLLLEPAMK